MRVRSSERKSACTRRDAANNSRSADGVSSPLKRGAARRPFFVGAMAVDPSSRSARYSNVIGPRGNAKLHWGKFRGPRGPRGALHTMIEIGIVGGTGYTGIELLRLLAQHPQARVKLITSRTEAGNARGRDVSEPPRAGSVERPRLQRSGEQRLKDLPCRFFRDAPRCRDEPGARARRRRGDDHRSCGGLSSQGSRRFRALVQDAAQLSRPSGGVGVRTSGDAQGGDCQGAHRRQSGLLSDRGPARIPAAGPRPASSTRRI